MFITSCVPGCARRLRRPTLAPIQKPWISGPAWRGHRDPPSGLLGLAVWQRSRRSCACGRAPFGGVRCSSFVSAGFLPSGWPASSAKLRTVRLPWRGVRARAAAERQSEGGPPHPSRTHGHTNINKAGGSHFAVAGRCSARARGFCASVKPSGSGGTRSGAPRMFHVHAMRRLHWTTVCPTSSWTKYAAYSITPPPLATMLHNFQVLDACPHAPCAMCEVSWP